MICLLSFLALIVLIFLHFKKVDCDLQLLFYEKFGKSTKSLADKVVWIVGASSGIGEYLAYELAKCGCKVVLSARRAEELERVKKKCHSFGNVPDDNVTVLPMDVLRYDQHKAKFDEVLRKYGQLDILLNNAGRTQRARWEDIEVEVDRQLFDLNLFSLVALTRVVMPHFLQKRAGHVVTMSSLAGIIGVPGSATYAGAKHALHGYMNSLRFEKVTENIKVTMLCPGPVHSNLLTTAFTSKANEVYSKEWKLLDRRMATDRCAELCAIAIANQTFESWISLNPVLLLTYISSYFPSLALRGLKMTGGVKGVSKLRDGDARSVKPKDK